MTCATQREMSPPPACSRAGLMRVSGVRGFFSKPRAFTKTKIVRLDFPERQKAMSSTQQSIPDGKAHPAEPSSPSRHAEPPTHEEIVAPRLRNIRCARRWTVDDVPNWLIAEQDELQVTYVDAFRQSLIRCIAGSSKAQKLAWY